MARPPEVDLHGHTVDQAIARFTGAYNAARAAGRSSRLIVIHGWNAGALRGSIADTLHRLLTRRGILFQHPHAGNLGRTAVRIGGALPPQAKQAAPKRLKAPKPHAPRGRLSGGL